jgi:hypothetical protein
MLAIEFRKHADGMLYVGTFEGDQLDGEGEFECAVEGLFSPEELRRTYVCLSAGGTSGTMASSAGEVISWKSASPERVAQVRGLLGCTSATKPDFGK